MSKAYDTYNYPKYWKNRDYEHESENIVITEFLDLLKLKHIKIIDIGCGYGRVTETYKDKVNKITLTDPSQSLLDIAKTNNKHSRKIKYKKSTIQNLSKNFKKNSHDLAICVRVFHHVENIDKALKNINYVLDKNGYLILEFANKLHGKAIFKNFLKGNFTFPLDIFPIDRRSKKNIKKQSILFLNHHPDVVAKSLEEQGFKILEKRSVSNFRYKLIKKTLPMNILLFLEKHTQKLFSKFDFGPSIFILAKKK